MTADALNVTPQQQSEILMQALPHMLRYDDAIVVVKYGGHAMGDEDTARNFASVFTAQSSPNAQSLCMISVMLPALKH